MSRGCVGIYYLEAALTAPSDAEAPVLLVLFLRGGGGESCVLFTRTVTDFLVRI